MNTNTAPSFVPTQEELDSLNREFGFIPTENQNPRVLTTQQINDFNEKGYVLGHTIFDENEMEEHRHYFDQLLDAVEKRGGDSYSISTAHLTFPEVYDILNHPNIVAAVSDLLGPNVVGWGSHYFCKKPHDGKTVDWHQDASYWPMSQTRTVTVWLAVDDADLENACMQFLAGSHQFGHIEYKASDASTGNVLTQTVENVSQYGTPANVVLKAGQVSIHSDLLLHGSGANHSDRRRCGLTLRYCPAEVRAGLDWNRKGVLVAGVDPENHWANPPRPSHPPEWANFS